MYTRILLALDNSEHSALALSSAVQLARACSSTLVGIHVYAARLHDTRFQEMEPGLAPKYTEEELTRQRRTHQSLIGFGLGVISESYLDIFEQRCREAGVPAERKTREGRNYVEIADELAAGGYDLVIMGALGLGQVPVSVIGSVCERVARAARCDVLVVRTGSSAAEGPLVVGIDGSDDSFAALQRAIHLSNRYERKVEGVSVFDPHFHAAAFRSIQSVLSEEAGRVFRFNEQEKLHNELIDGGLARLYEGHLRQASRIAAGRGVELNTRLLPGKAFEAISQHARQSRPSLLVVGRFGFHDTGRVDIGSNAENLLRLAPCDVLVCGNTRGMEREGKAPIRTERAMFRGKAVDAVDNAGSIESPEIESQEWTPEAAERIQRVPPFARQMARRGIENYAKDKGCRTITTAIVDEALRSFGR